MRSSASYGAGRHSLCALASSIEFTDHLHDVGLLLFGQLSINGERQHFFGRAFRNGKRSFVVAEIVVAILQVHGKRIIHFGPDTLLLQEVPELITLSDSHRVLVVHVEVSVSGDRQQHAIEQLSLCEEMLVAVRIPPAAFGPLIEVPQFDMEHRSLQSIQPAVDANCFM